MSYVPAAGTLPNRVCAYFIKNPEEALSTQDIALKFDASPNSISTNLAAALGAKLLERFKSGGSLAWQYRAGAALARLHKDLGTDAAPTLGAFSRVPPAERKPQVRAPSIDLTTVSIEANVPMPASVRKRTDWSVVFERFAAPGMCSSPLPRECKSSLSSQAAEWFKAKGWKYAIRTVSDTHLRIWRTE